MTPTKKELSQGLTYVRGMLGKMQNVLAQYIAQERNFRKITKKIDTKATVKNDLPRIFTISLFALIALLIFVSIDPNQKSDAVIALVFMAISFVCEKIVVLAAKAAGTEMGALTLMTIRRNTRYTIGKFSFYFLMIYGFFRFLAYVAVIAVIYEAGKAGILVLAAVIAIDVFLIAMKNKKISASNQNAAVNNEQVQAKRKVLHDQYNALQRELLNHAPDWFPPDYYSVEAVDFFLHAIRNGRADSVKEMVNLFESSNQHKEMVAYQKEQTKRLNQLINGQQAIQEQLRFANMMHVENFIKLDDIAAAVRHSGYRS